MSNYSESLFKKKLTRVALSWSNLVLNTNVSTPLLKKLKENSFLSENEYNQLARESENETYHHSKHLIGILLTKMQAYDAAMTTIQNPNLIAQRVNILDPFDLFSQAILKVNADMSFLISDIENMPVSNRHVEYLFNDLMPFYTEKGEPIDWVEIGSSLENIAVDDPNIMLSGSIATHFMEESEQLNSNRSRRSKAPRTDTRASSATPRRDLPDASFSTSPGGAHASFPTAMRPVQSVNAASASPSSSFANSRDPNVIIDDMVKAFAQVGVKFKQKMPKDVLDSVNKANVPFLELLFSSKDHEAARIIEEICTKTFPILPSSTALDVFIGISIRLVFLALCYLNSKVIKGHDVARGRVVRWFILIVEKDILSFLRKINWFALWSQVKSQVTQFLSTRSNPLQPLLDYGRGLDLNGYGIIGSVVVICVGIVFLYLFVKNRNIPPLQ